MLELFIVVAVVVGAIYLLTWFADRDHDNHEKVAPHNKPKQETPNGEDHAWRWE